MSKGGREWVLQHDFEASSSGGCTAMCWRPHTARLPAMILLGTQRGAKVAPVTMPGSSRYPHSLSMPI